MGAGPLPEEESASSSPAATSVEGSGLVRLKCVPYLDDVLWTLDVLGSDSGDSFSFGARGVFVLFVLNKGCGLIG